MKPEWVHTCSSRQLLRAGPLGADRSVTKQCLKWQLETPASIRGPPHDTDRSHCTLCAWISLTIQAIETNWTRVVSEKWLKVMRRRRRPHTGRVWVWLTLGAFLCAASLPVPAQVSAGRDWVTAACPLMDKGPVQGVFLSLTKRLLVQTPAYPQDL